MTIGTTLREARLRRGIALEDISRATNIPRAVLDTIERDDLARVPGGLFARAYLRAYARQVGLDPEPLVREYAAHHDAPPDDELDALRLRYAARSEDRRRGLRLAAAAAILAALLYSMASFGESEPFDESPAQAVPAAGEPDSPPTPPVA